jgi:hypothetical protein
MAMAMRGRCGLDREEFDLVFEDFAMLSQYTANAAVETRLAASQTADDLVLRATVAPSG